MTPSRRARAWLALALAFAAATTLVFLFEGGGTLWAFLMPGALGAVLGAVCAGLTARGVGSAAWQSALAASLVQVPLLTAVVVLWEEIGCDPGLQCEAFGAPLVAAWLMVVGAVEVACAVLLACATRVVASRRACRRPG